MCHYAPNSFLKEGWWWRPHTVLENIVTDVRRHRSRSVNVRLAFLSQHPSEPLLNTSFRSPPSEQAARGTVTTMFILIFKSMFLFCLWGVRPRLPWQRCGDQKMSCRCLFSFPTPRVPGIKLRLSVLVGSTFRPVLLCNTYCVTELLLSLSLVNNQVPAARTDIFSSPPEIHFVS